jgi:hypothetical protein
MTYRVYRQYHIRQSSQSHKIDEVTRPGLINPRDTSCANAFLQLPFHILPLRLLIVAWLNRDLILSALHLMFIAISRDRLIDAVSLSPVCEPNVFDGKNCFGLGLQILGSLPGGSSGTLRNTLQQLFCSRQIARFSTLSPPDVFPIDIHSPVSGFSTWIECLGVIQLDIESRQKIHSFIFGVILLKPWSTRMDKRSYGEIL